MKKIIILILFIIFGYINNVFAETSSFSTKDGIKYCETHVYDEPYNICSKEQIDKSDLVDAGFNGPKYMEVGSGKTITGKICVENGKEVDKTLCNGQDDNNSTKSITEDIIKKTCNGIEKNNDFYHGYDCSGSEKNVYYIKNQKVTKEKYDSEKNIYNEKGPICEETKNSTPEELPQDFSAKCVKGSYGEYYYKEKSLQYSDWSNKVIQSGIQSSTENYDKEIQKNLDIQKTQLQTFDSFINSIKDKTWKGVSSYNIIGGDCNSEGSMIFNGNGYKNLICINNKIESLDYVLDNKIVSYDVYMNTMYENEKKAIDTQVEYYKTHDSMGNKKVDISNNETKDSKQENITKSVLQDNIITTKKPKQEEMTKVKTGPELYIILLFSFLIGILILNRKKIQEKFKN
ncbi:hypothetical protein EOM39_06230 [Candidatus Gracilibacteria bacterium]|nr:hypothetical protein [Candidatus Gracilibacteria bacterium]